MLVPTLLRAILNVHPNLGTLLPSLRYTQAVGSGCANSPDRHITSSGEPLPRDLAAAVQTAIPSAMLLNLYGTTEVGGDVTCAVHSWLGDCFVVDPEGEKMQIWPLYVSIGQSIPGCEVSGQGQGSGLGSSTL